MHLDPVADPWPDPFVSTGRLPDPGRVQRLLDEAHQRYRGVTDGEVSTVYPALGAVDPDRFGLCVVGTDGGVHAAGDADVDFTIMSVAKPFTFALVGAAIGVDAARDRIGANATGLPFNSLVAVERNPGGTTNPMVNPGAIATVGLVPGADVEARWAWVHDGLSRFAGRRLELDDGVLESARTANHRNRAIAALLHSVGALGADPGEAVEVYTRQSCLRVTARDLAVMGATLADGGVNPITGDAVVDAAACRATLAVMVTAGMYETSGEWVFDVGLPAKSGIGGGIVTAAPGKGGLATFSPRLDGVGNSVRGQLATRWLSRAVGLDLFGSLPVG